MTKYKITFSNGKQIVLDKASVNDEKRFVEQEAKNHSDRQFEYNYYPFENILSIEYIGED